MTPTNSMKSNVNDSCERSSMKCTWLNLFFGGLMFRRRFKEFCKKMERVAKHHRFHLEYHESTKISSQNTSQIRFDIPYRDLGFHGVPNREMVLIQPTVRCLVNLTETPFFLVELDRVPNQSGKFWLLGVWYYTSHFLFYNRLSIFILRDAPFDQRISTWS